MPLLSSKLPFFMFRRRFVQHTTLEQLEAMVNAFHNKVAATVEAYDSKSKSRDELGASMNRMLRLRYRIFDWICRERPELMVQIFARRALPHAPDGSVNPIVRDVLEVLQLTEWQVEELKRIWDVYHQSMSQARQELRSAVANATTRAQSSSDAAVMSWSNAAVEGYLHLIDVAAVLEEHPKRENRALLELLQAFQAAIEPIQRIRMVAKTSPYVPDPLQILGMLFEEGKGATR